MEFQLSYFKSWKMMLWKYCTQYASEPIGEIKDSVGASLVIHSPNVGDPALIPGQGIKFHMLQLKDPHAETKIKDPVCLS